MSPISKSLRTRKSGHGKSLWLCAMTASACLADKALLWPPALCNRFSQLQLTGSTPGTSLPHKCVFLRSYTLHVFKMHEFKGNQLLFGRGWPSSLFSAGQVISFHLNGVGVKDAPLRAPQSKALQPPRRWERHRLTVSLSPGPP